LSLKDLTKSTKNSKIVEINKQNTSKLLTLVVEREREKERKKGGKFDDRGY